MSEATPQSSSQKQFQQMEKGVLPKNRKHSALRQRPTRRTAAWSHWIPHRLTALWRVCPSFLQSVWASLPRCAPLPPLIPLCLRLVYGPVSWLTFMCRKRFEEIIATTRLFSSMSTKKELLTSQSSPFKRRGPHVCFLQPCGQSQIYSLLFCLLSDDGCLLLLSGVFFSLRRRELIEPLNVWAGISIALT